MICPYCKNEAKYGPNEEYYGKRYGNSYMCYYCKPCDAYVGTHQNTTQALGSMANRELRKMRMKVHAYLDPLWKEGKIHRGHMYRNISKILGYEYHTGSTTMEDCERVLQINHDEILK